jgi:hypothetical protein
MQLCEYGLTKNNDDIARWIKSCNVDFQIFASLRPENTSTINHIKQSIHEFINFEEKQYKTILSCVVGYESSPVANCHMCVTASRRLDRFRLNDYWHFLPWDTQFQPYDENQNGIRYTLKGIDYMPDFDYELHHMDLYLKESNNRKTKRHQERMRIGYDTQLNNKECE